jgi:hypothetical protein
MRKLFERYWTLLAAVGAYGLSVIFLLNVSLKQNQGAFIYPLDDTYIHTAIAKHWIQAGIWGVTRHEFSSTTSSPLWTGLIAVSYHLVGVNDWTPLALNLVCGVVVLLATQRLMQSYLTQGWLLVAQLGIVWLTSLPVLALSGMEHTLHLGLTLWFAGDALTLLTTSEAPPSRMYLTAAALSMARFEGLFLLGVVCLGLLWRRQVWAALSLGVSGFLPVAAYGLWSLSHGWYFLPNSLLLKGNLPALDSLSGIINALGYRALYYLGFTPHLAILFFVSAFALAYARRRQLPLEREALMLNGLFLATTLLHLQFASVGWFYRYEAYLVCWGLVGCACLLPKVARTLRAEMTRAGNRLRVALLMLIVGFGSIPLGVRAVNAWRDAPQATTNIYEQQYQMARFVQQFYQGQAIALNDIGAVNYLSDIRTVDLYGLGTLPVVGLKRARQYDTEAIAALTQRQGVKIALLYEHIYDEYGGLPSAWSKVGEWTISNNVICGDTRVAIYAVEPTERPRLIEALRQFQTQLPKTVAQAGAYLP